MRCYNQSLRFIMYTPIVTKNSAAHIFQFADLRTQISISFESKTSLADAVHFLHGRSDSSPVEFMYVHAVYVNFRNFTFNSL